MSHGIYDTAQKAWLHIFDTLEEAEAKFLHLDVRTAKVAPFTAEAPAAPEDGEPKAPQEEVRVVGNAPQEGTATPAEETPAADPEVAADVSA